MTPMDDLQIDVDSEAIFLDGAWYTRDDLSRRIKAMLDAGDYNVARPSTALEVLTQTVRDLRTLSFRCTPDLEAALGELAARTNASPGAIIREALSQFFQEAGLGASAAPAPAPVQEPTSAQSFPSLPVVVDIDEDVDEPRQQEPTVRRAVPVAPPGDSGGDLPKVIVEGPQEVIPGPGALANAGVGKPLELTNRKPAAPADEAVSSEHRWFKQ